MAKTIEQLKAQGAEVKNATVVGENTATRVGALFNDIVEHVEAYEQAQAQNDESLNKAIVAETARAKAAEEANATSIIGTDRIADGAVTTEKLADSAIDDEPTAGSDNLVKSEGVVKNANIENYNKFPNTCILPLQSFKKGVYNNNGEYRSYETHLTKVFSVKGVSKIKLSCIDSTLSSSIKYSFRTGVFPDLIPISGSIIDLEIPIGEKVEINVPNGVNYIQIYKNDFGESTFFYNTLLVEFVSELISELKSGLELEISTRQSEDANISANSSGDVWHSFIDRNNAEVVHTSTPQYTVASPFFKILKTTNPIVIKNVFKGKSATPLTFYDKNAGLLSQVIPDGETDDYDITVAAEDIPEDAVYFRVTSRVQNKRYEVTNGQIVSAESILPSIRNRIITVTELTVLSSSMTVARIPVKGGSIVKLVSADWNETRNGTTMRMSSGDIHYGITFLGDAKMYPGRYFKIQDDTRYIDFVVSDTASFNSITVEILDEKVSDSIRKDYLTNSRNGIVKTLLPSDFFAGVYNNAGSYSDKNPSFFSCVLDVIPNQRFKITNIDAATTPKYSYRNVNPIDSTSTFVGGNAEIVLNNEYTIPSNCNAIIIYFNNADVENWYLNSITYEIIADNEKRFESIETNIDTLNESQIINASPIQIISTFASRKMSLDGSTTGVARHRRLVVAHITDTHDDRERVQRFANFVENHSIIDFAVHTGDVVGHTNWQTYFNYFTNKMCYLSIGNHECDEYSEHLVSNLKSGYMQSLVDKGVSVTSHCAYYEDKTDADGHVIRFIFLNEYDYPDSVTRAQMKAAGANGYYNAIFSQEQIDWFIARLQECITNNYYVCICSHQKPVAVQSNDKGFFQDAATIFKNNPDNNYNGNMLLEIVNAFKTGSSINESYAPNTSLTSLLPTITVNTTFSGNGKFIAWMDGHNHGDYIGYDSIYKNQLILNNTLAKASSFIVSGGSLSGERLYSDLPRDIDGDTQDAYNVYVFDIDNSKVHVVRIGSNLNYNGKQRKYASFIF